MSKVFGYEIDRESTDNLWNIDTQEIAEYLCKLSTGNMNCTNDGDMDMDSMITEVENCLFYIKCAAENPYNHDYFRVLLRVLSEITNYDYLED